MKKTILHVMPSLNEGGAERFVVDLCNSQSTKFGYEVHLIVLFEIQSGMFLADQINHSVQVYSLNKKIGFDFRMFFLLFKLIRNIKPDVVNSHLGAFENLLLCQFFLTKIRYYHTIHSEALNECPSSQKRKIRKFLYRNGKVIPVTISKESSNSFRQIYELSNDSIVYNGRSNLIESKRFTKVKNDFTSIYRKTKNTRVVLNIGSISTAKNQVVLAQSVNKLIQDGNDLVLLIIGGARPGAEAIYNELVNQCNSRVIMLGVKDNIQDYLFLADAFCLSSQLEGMPISLLEAFSAKCIALCTPVGGIMNMIEDGVTGLLSKGITSEDIKELLVRYLSLEEVEINRIVDRANKNFNLKYSIDKSAEEYIKVYKLTS